MEFNLGNCPFCGDSVRMEKEDNLIRIIHNNNQECIIWSIVFDTMTPEEIAKSWNERVIVLKIDASSNIQNTIINSETTNETEVEEPVEEESSTPKSKCKKWDSMTPEQQQKYLKKLEYIKNWQQRNPNKVKQYQKNTVSHREQK